MQRLLDLIGDRSPALYFAIVNMARIIKLGPGGACCQSCGLYTLLSRLSWPRFSTGERLPVCVEWDDLQVLIEDMAEAGAFDRIAA